MLTRRMTRMLVLVVTLCLTLGAVPAQNHKADKAAVRADDLQKWLSYLASDELEGRATFSEGLGLAAAYLAEQLRSWGVKPGGDNGSFLQRARVTRAREGWGGPRLIWPSNCARGASNRAATTDRTFSACAYSASKARIVR